MKFAVDRYKIGREKEVSADEFEGQYIPLRRSRFYCPECGEIVYFRAKGGTHPNQFFHQEKNDGTPECDRRIDGRSELSLRERVGLPIFISKIGKSIFELNIGFPALGRDILFKAMDAQYTVEISFGNRSQKIGVNYTNFIEDETTLIPVNFLPNMGKNYHITVSGQKAVYGIHRKWSDYADGFEYGGAVFTYSETGGKKIRRGDSISTNRPYYLLTSIKIPELSEIQRSVEGKIILGNTTFVVYKIEVVVSFDDKVKFAEINRYFNRVFGVWLLERQPELVPLWPPVVEQDAFIPIVNTDNIVCAVSSGNSTPNVYVYSDRGVNILDNCQRENNTYIAQVNVSNKPTVLSVDRKYVGREATFVKRNVHISNGTYSINVEKNGKIDSLGNIFDDGNIRSDFRVFANSKVDLYFNEGRRIYKHLAVRSNETVVENKAQIEEIFWVIEAGIIRRFKYNNESTNNVSFDHDVVNHIIKAHGSLVPIPRWTVHVLLKLISISDVDDRMELRNILSRGIIHIDALKYLKSIEKDV